MISWNDGKWGRVCTPYYSIPFGNINISLLIFCVFFVHFAFYLCMLTGTTHNDEYSVQVRMLTTTLSHSHHEAMQDTALSIAISERVWQHYAAGCRMQNAGGWMPEHFSILFTCQHSLTDSFHSLTCTSFHSIIAFYRSLQMYKLKAKQHTACLSCEGK